MEYDIVLAPEALEFLASLEVKMRAKAYRTLGLLRMFGTALTMPHSRKLVNTKDLYELRVQQANNICRLFYFYHENRIYVVLSGFIKKQNKTDKNEIERALSLKERFLKGE